MYLDAVQLHRSWTFLNENANHFLSCRAITLVLIGDCLFTAIASRNRTCRTVVFGFPWLDGCLQKKNWRQIGAQTNTSTDDWGEYAIYAYNENAARQTAVSPLFIGTNYGRSYQLDVTL